MIRLSLVLFCCLGTAAAAAQSTEQRLQQQVDSFYNAHPRMVGIIAAVTSAGSGIHWQYAAGYSDRQAKTPAHPDQPVNVASNTKTYVSATILKLAEQHKIDIHQSIESLLQPHTKELMLQAGYQPSAIKITHLLSHTSGIRDYVTDDYLNYVDQNKAHHWNRDEQIALAMKGGGPLAPPGDTFSYADVNYLLATEIIGTVTKQPFYTAVANLLGFRQHHLNNTWFTELQKSPRHSRPAAHQYWDKKNWDTYDINPSWDLYGGGGIVTTATDLARFFQLLFDGKIIRDTTLLNQMVNPVYSKTNYCLGARRLEINGYTAYYHGGFWGTDAIYFPQLKTAVTIFILEKGEKDISAEICKHILSILTTP